MGMEGPRGKRFEMEMLREETEEAERGEAGKWEWRVQEGRGLKWRC